jgi:hypothetical protein
VSGEIRSLVIRWKNSLNSAPMLYCLPLVNHRGRLFLNLAVYTCVLCDNIWEPWLRQSCYTHRDLRSIHCSSRYSVGRACTPLAPATVGHSAYSCLQLLGCCFSFVDYILLESHIRWGPHKCPHFCWSLLPSRYSPKKPKMLKPLSRHQNGGRRSF